MQKHFRKVLFAALLLTAVMLCSFAAAEEAHTVHEWSEWYQESPATCQSRAIWKRTCSVCGAVDRETRGDFAAHSWNYNSPVITFVACESPQNVYYYCSVCGHRSDVMNTLAAPGHKYGDWVRSISPTCVATGKDTRTCSVCGNQETRDVAATGVHTWSNWLVTKPATCTEAGSQTRTCTVCNKSETESIPALGHSWGSWTVTKAATCSEAGQRVRICGRDSSHVETETIPALGQSSTTGHTFGPWEVTVEPSCGKTGLRTRTCTACGRTETETMAALNHSWSAWRVVTPASCQDTGVEERTCAICGEKQERTINKTNHEWGNWTVLVEATCEDTGTEIRTCRICGVTERRYTAVGTHKWNPWVMEKEPTCTEPGSRYHVCKVCNTRETEIIPALGHVWTDWITVIPSTDDTTGIEQRTCPVCGTVESRQIGVVGGDQTVCAFGPRLVDMGDRLAPGSNKWYMFTPFDISMNGTQTYELVADNQYIVGSLTITVRNGNLTVNYKIDSPYLRVDLEFFTILDSMQLLNEYEPEQLVAEYGLQPGRTYSLADLNIPYDNELVLYFCSRVTYTYDADNMSTLNYNSSIHQAQVNAMLSIMD